MKISLALLLFTIIIFLSCTTLKIDKRQMVEIIPQPQSVKLINGSFEINKDTKISYEKEFEKIDNVVNYLNKQLENSADLQLKTGNADANYILFKYDSMIKNSEGYNLDVKETGITISASTSNGSFYGVQSLLQLLSPNIYSKTKQDFSLEIPFVEIKDEPRFSWRGVHLDVGRHFYDKEEIKKFIDYLAIHKMKQFHWHLTEDQGWRIEIKKYPRLTEIGSIRKETAGDGKPHGGFYSQDDVREIVKYAEERFITVVPEIELPGHSLAALAAYPEYACTEGPFQVGTIFGVHKEVYCAGNEKTYTFLEDILGEVIELFPSEYVHIGGDECPKDRWEKCTKCQAKILKEKLHDEHELQSYFIKRIEKILQSKNKNLIGWDEILEGGLAPQATVMSWRGIEGGITAAKEKHDVIMTPTSHCYFDYYQGNPENEPVAIGGYLPISTVYSYEPIPEELTKEEAKHILGTQANVWTEYLPEFKDVEYMLMPRLAALSEVCWTNPESKGINSFLKRLATQLKRYEALDVNYAKSSFNVSIGTKLNKTTKALDVDLTTEFSGAEIYYSTDGSTPDNNFQKYTSPFSLNKTQEIKAVSYNNDRLMSAVSTKKIIIHKAFGKAVKLTNMYADKYSAGGEFGLVDGMFGTSSFSAGGWQGFEGVDFEAIIDLGTEIKINEIISNFHQRTNSWIFMPKYVQYSFSSDGKKYSDPIRIENDIPENSGEVESKNFSITQKKLKTRYIKVFAKSIEKCPDWHLGAGGKAWLFIDEIIVE